MASSSSSSMNALPFAVLNMGTEILYILEQRLRAQQIPQEKANRVLLDITGAMLQEEFVQHMMQPQEMYSIHSLMQVFERIVHSSIMHLKPSSMEKLFDLTIMALKYQLVTVLKPQEVMRVTETHLDTLANILPASLEQTRCNSLLAQLRERYGQLSGAEWRRVRHSLLALVSGKNVKVNLLLQDELQCQDGTFKLPPANMCNATGREVGDIEACTSQQDKPQALKLVAAQHAGSEFPGHPIEPGMNMYGANRPVPRSVAKQNTSSMEASASESSADPTDAAYESSADDASEAHGDSENARERGTSNVGASGAYEANMLAALVGRQSRADINARESFKLDILSNQDADKQNYGRSERTRVEFEQVASERSNSNLDTVRRDLESGLRESNSSTEKDRNQEDTAEDGDDLLSLMDSAA